MSEVQKWAMPKEWSNPTQDFMYIILDHFPNLPMILDYEGDLECKWGTNVSNAKKVIKSNSWLYVYHFGAFSESFHNIALWGWTWVKVRYKIEQCQSNAPLGQGAPHQGQREPRQGHGEPRQEQEGPVKGNTHLNWPTILLVLSRPFCGPDRPPDSII